MDYGKVLKRAWHILWSYRALWVFGIILALTTASGGGGSSGTGYTFDRNDLRGSNIAPPAELQRQLEELGEAISELFDGARVHVPAWLIVLAVVLGILLLAWIVFSIIARWVSEVSLIRMVDDYEETEERKSVRQGIRLGWSRRAWRLFLIGLVITLPIFVCLGLLFALAFSPLLLWAAGDTAAGVFGTVTAIGLFFLTMFVAMPVAIVAALLLRFAWRACSLEDLGVKDSIRRGYTVIKDNWKSVGLMWLIMFGVRLGFALVTIPVVFLMLALGGVSGGLVLVIVRGIAGLLFTASNAWIVGGVSAGVVFMVVLIIPLVFISGLYETFVSTSWTLTYRELKALSSVKTKATPAVTPATEAEADGA